MERKLVPGAALKPICVPIHWLRRQRDRFHYFFAFLRGLRAFVVII